MTYLELLTTDEMARADRLAVRSGVASRTLMENAGAAVASEVRARFAPGSRVVVLCGPGNNGGDGFVTGRLLKRASYDVRLYLLGDRAALKGDAAEMARRFDGPVRKLAAGDGIFESVHVVIDALFGAGLSRALDGEASAIIEELNISGKAVVAVDVPSGLDATTGAVVGSVVQAIRTVTFFRRKPGHLLMPGRARCGEVLVADIGIPECVLADLSVQTFGNEPALWRSAFPALRSDGHKYQRGHAVVVSGPVHATGAARLAARASLRAGAGLVTLATPPDAIAVNAAQLTAVMLAPFEGARGLAEMLEDRRRNAVLIGPGHEGGDVTRSQVQSVLGSGAAVVLDADALTSFEGRFEDFRGLIAHRAEANVVLTPHDGEFKRLFGDVAGSKLDRARQAAARVGAVVVLKGPDTVIAAPDGRAAINANAPPSLATAGSGDVLAGLLTGLLAQGMPPFEAACAAAWLHGAAAREFGPGLIAEDLPDALPAVLRQLTPRP